MENSKNKAAFTLVEIILVSAAFVIIVGIVILALNPSKKLADSRDSQRQVDVNSILNATYKYAVDHNGNMPSALTASNTEICFVAPCGPLVDLSALVAPAPYLASAPRDPGVVSTAAGSGYFIFVDTNNDNRVTVSAPNAESGQIIRAVR